jgi:hypothetical protein
VSCNRKAIRSFIIHYNFILEKTELEEREAQQEVVAVGGVRRAVAARNRLGLRNRGQRQQLEDEPRIAGFNHF